MRVTLYGKPGCGICDEARLELRELLDGRGVGIEEIDVSADPGLHAEYGERIPVIAVDGEEICELGLDRKALEGRLAKVGR